MLLCVVHDLRGFGLRHVTRIQTNDAVPLVVDMQHDLRRFRFTFVKELLEHVDDERRRLTFLPAGKRYETLLAEYRQSSFGID